jgi:hypothetical protein
MKRFVAWFMEEGWAAIAVVSWFVLITLFALKFSNH